MSEQLKEKVATVVAEKIRPGLQMDGGNIELVDVSDDGVVRVRLQGHCATCPFAAMTLAVGVEKTLKEALPEVKRVEPVA